MTPRTTAVRRTAFINCEVCGRPVQLHGGGRVRLHKPHRNAGIYASFCGGSGRRQTRWPVGQRLRHHSGTVWVVREDRVDSSTYRDYLIECIDLGVLVSRYEEVGRQMVVHGEYLHRDGWEEHGV